METRRVTIVREDNMVGVDGLFYRIDCSGLPVNLRAVQWFGSEVSSEVEYLDVPNEVIFDFTPYQYLVDEWQVLRDAEQAQLDHEAALEEDPYYDLPPEEQFERRKEDSYAELVARGTAATSTFIQAPVDKYNADNGLAFVNVHNCNSYIRSPGYSHHDFCQEVWDWSVIVWEECRVIQGQIATGEIDPPESEEAFWAMLTPYTGTGA